MPDGGATLIIVPVLNRPHRVAPLVESITANTPERHRVVFVCTPGDRNETEEVAGSGCDWFVMPCANDRGDYAKKINAAYSRSTEPFLFLAADDLAFHPGWLAAALAKMTEGVCVVGTNDLGSARVMAGEHSTHSLVRRSYADNPGTIDEQGKVLHEGYWHEYVDDEFVKTAIARGVFAHAMDSVVEHLHPCWGKAPLDDLYAMQRMRMKHGRRVFWRREHLWSR